MPATLSHPNRVPKNLDTLRVTKIRLVAINIPSRLDKVTRPRHLNPIRNIPRILRPPIEHREDATGVGKEVCGALGCIHNYRMTIPENLLSSGNSRRSMFPLGFLDSGVELILVRHRRNLFSGYAQQLSVTRFRSYIYLHIAARRRAPAYASPFLIDMNALEVSAVIPSLEHALAHQVRQV